MNENFRILHRLTVIHPLYDIFHSHPKIPINNDNEKMKNPMIYEENTWIRHSDFYSRFGDDFSTCHRAAEYVISISVAIIDSF